MQFDGHGTRAEDTQRYERLSCAGLVPDQGGRDDKRREHAPRVVAEVQPSRPALTMP